MPPAKSTPNLSLALVLFATAAALLTGCERIPEKLEISETREISEFDPQPRLETPARVRLGISDTVPLPETEDSGAPKENPIVSITPDGWKLQPPTSQFRLITYTFGPDDIGLVYVSALPTDAATADFVTPNINRWRTQMGQPPLSAPEIDALPEITLFGAPGSKVTVDGEFTPVGASSPQPDYRLLGAILQLPQITLFVKMTGPKDLIEAQEANFDAFTTSLHIRGSRPEPEPESEPKVEPEPEPESEPKVEPELEGDPASEPGLDPEAPAAPSAPPSE